jgi:hypothetical protein
MGYEIFIPITFFIVAGAILSPFARAYAKRIEQSPGKQQIPNELRERLERMEQAIDAIAVEVERISEAQRFTTRLLSQSSASGTLPRGESDT